jgi:hypothetical protein
MSYSLFWRDTSLPFTQKQVAIDVPAGSTVSTAASLRFTGKGAANYGKVQQENLMRLLENFASGTSPENPTVGQLWFDTSISTLKVCVATAPSPVSWRTIKTTQIGEIGEAPPSPAALGDSWFSKTGSSSGFGYHYTGLGRFPQTNWTSTGYYPTTNTTTLGAKINSSAFNNAPGTNPGEAYIHGYVSGVGADVDGSVTFNGTSITLLKGVLNTTFPTPVDQFAFIMYDRSQSLLAGTSYFTAFKDASGQWFYDRFGSSTNWTAFTPSTVADNEQIIIGTLVVADIDATTSTGITSLTLWNEAKYLADVEHVPATLINGSIGGWQQYSPNTLVVAGRYEYDLALQKLLKLIGDTFINGGSGAYDLFLKNRLTPFNTLDASLSAAWKSRTPVDTNVATNTPAGLELLRVQPTSQDWDKLLAIAKWAIDRYELPNGFASNVPDVPFVQDGLPMDSATAANYGIPHGRNIALSTVGQISLARMYQECLNILEAAVSKRYVLKGLLGQSGVNTDFGDNVEVTGHVSYSANVTGAPLTANPFTGLRFQFAANEMHRFFTSGQAIEIVFTHNPGVTPTASDIELKSITDNSGRARFTMDKFYTMTSSATPSLSAPPVDGGFSLINGTINASVVQTFATYSVGSSTISVRAQRGFANANSIDFYVYVNTASSTTGTFDISWNWVNDTEEYMDTVSTRIYPEPAAFEVSHKLGSTLWTASIPVT